MTFSHLVSAFFQNYLVAERGLASHTIASYSDGLKLLIQFACARLGLQPEALRVEQFSPELILAFLDDLEKNRGNTAATRNQRLAVVKTFFHFLARHQPEFMHLNETIQAIGQKKTAAHPPPSLTVKEVNALLEAPDPNHLLGARDRALMWLMYHSGGRVQEIADLQIRDIRFEAPMIVTLTGKGAKTRTVPLSEQAAAALTHYLDFRERAGVHSDHLFLSVKEQPLTRFGIGKRVEKWAREAARNTPSLRDRRITPHVFRHTIALHLLESDNDIVLVQEWLGHADLRTTSHYLEVSVERKRAALAKVPAVGEQTPPELPEWNKPSVITFLKELSHGVMLRKSG